MEITVSLCYDLSIGYVLNGFKNLIPSKAINGIIQNHLMGHFLCGIICIQYYRIYTLQWKIDVRQGEMNKDVITKAQKKDLI